MPGGTWSTGILSPSASSKRRKISMNTPDYQALARSATLHCLTGCAIGEILGLIIGTIAGFDTLTTVVLAVILAFIFGYSLSALPLVQSGLALRVALGTVLAADTLSIATMEIVDNTVMTLIPGGMNAGLVNPVFWVGMLIALTVAFFAAYPVNLYLLKRGKGHALVHQYHESHDHHH
ncbi:MAG: hypothetical protein JWM00_29 [Candidatus Saccharibacteria bacterium]|nr:hypothetical protein [Candidatus Saccharibacteria bacterium]